jgi:predicted 3-demethylubiquinone-9 3-methyltransferase (glyoxalase superfamily)
MQTITPCLWFDTQAEEAAKYYVSIFKNSRLGRISRYLSDGHEMHAERVGKVLTVEFELNGQTFTALNGGPVFKFNEAISLQVSCKTQDEVDHYWSQLGAGGDERAQQCGWVKDKYGVSWQVVPEVLVEMLIHPEVDKAQRAMAAMMQMKKLDIAALQKAFQGR